VVIEPHVENGLRDVRVAIVGAGFGGIGAAIRLREAGYERTMDARGATAVDVRREVLDRFDEEIQRRLAPTVWNSGGCYSWYVGADGRNFTIWPAFANEYKRRRARFDPAEFELTSTPAATATA
jgi:glycine/D-amino acid oxidase-like deaminating enzyme